MTRTLLLDLDGTLVDSVPDLLASCNRIMALRGFAPLSRADITPMIGDGAAALLQRIMAARGQEATPADLHAFLDDYMAHVADHTCAYPGVAETLTCLAAAGWHLAVCTNKPVMPARAVLAKLGLLDRFAAIGGGDSYPARKPDPAHLLATLADAGGAPGMAVMVGDHYNDVASAHAAHIPCIFAAWGYGPISMGATANAVAHTFTDVPEMAKALLNAPL